MEMTTEEKMAAINAETDAILFTISIRKWILRRLEKDGFAESKLATEFSNEIKKVDRRITHVEHQLRESSELEQLVLTRAVEIEISLDDQRRKCKELLQTRNATAAQTRDELDEVQRLIVEYSTRKSPCAAPSLLPRTGHSVCTCTPPPPIHAGCFHPLPAPHPAEPASPPRSAA